MPFEIVDLKPALLFTLHSAHIHINIWGVKNEGINSEKYVSHGYMARIEAFGMGHIVHVVVQFSTVPVKSSYFIYAVFQSEVGRFRHGLVHIGVYRHRVAGQM